MSVRIQVVGRDNRPAEGERVDVSWVSGGTSSGRTDSNGILDCLCSEGTARSVRVNGEEVLSNTWLGDKINPVNKP